MKIKAGGILDDDPRNPQYWEKRIGYPIATRDWLDCKENGATEHSDPQFTGEAFCRGFDLTAGQFYRLKKKAIPLLLENDLFKKDWAKDWRQVRWDATRIERIMKDEPLLEMDRLPVKPEPFWVDYMVHEFVLACKKWMEQYEAQVRDGSWYISGRWKHGPESTYLQWQWKGHYQYQHLKFKIRKGRSPDYITFDAHRVLPGLDGVTFTPQDVKLEDFRWQTFLDELKSHDYNPTTTALVYITPVETQITVYDDDSLQGAILSLRNANKGSRNYTIMFIALEKLDPFWVASSHDVDEDRRPEGKRKRGDDGGDKKKKKKSKKVTSKGTSLVITEY
ncbi:hypothetical protein P171DRAFT_495856 [Karstenula rhodostoma CBS 690.94]|uniref:Uncharacterized protein n=1 Tax=Karstenula rhodostoma CBS 690.94 TaxID=1392251 RepID=A0A9P4PGR5_9PLEO|nr:hypothetical protein P171DRAFT_495856 [Karstenula rhodostoma CBS 690.94]